MSTSNSNLLSAKKTSGKAKELNMNRSLNKANKSHTFSLMHQNFQCLRNKIYEVDILLNDELDNVDVLCCTEHWLSESEIKCFQLQNYTLSSYYCRKNYKNGGSAIYIKKNLSHIKKHRHTNTT